MTRILIGLAVAAIAWSMPTDALAQGMEAGVTYWTEVTLGESTCDNVTIKPGPTEIVRLAGDSLSVSHAGQTYVGSITREGDFITKPRELAFGSTTYTIAITGRLLPRQLTAVVTVGVREQGSATGCRYTVNWTGRL